MIIEHENITVLLNSTDEEIRNMIVNTSFKYKLIVHSNTNSPIYEDMPEKEKYLMALLPLREKARKKNKMMLDPEDKTIETIAVRIMTMNSIQKLTEFYKDCKESIVDSFLVEHKLWIIDDAKVSTDEVQKMLYELTEGMLTDMEYVLQANSNKGLEIIKSAREYEKQSDEAIRNANILELVKIKRRINISSSQGHYDCILPEETSKPVLEYLRRKSFSIEDYVKGGKRIVKVHW